MRLAVWLALALACGGGQRATEKSATPTPTPAVQPAASETMNRHFVELRVARDDLIKGDVLGAEAQLVTMSRKVSPEGQPSEWAPYLVRLRAALRAGTYANDPQSVGRSIAAAAAVCGECHSDLGARVDLHLPPPPGQNVGVIAHMKRHAWAADRMWAGLIGPSPGAWADASAVLADGPLYQAPEGKLMSNAARTYAEEVVHDGVDTLTAASEQKRIQLYGDFLGACGSCHVVTDGGPTAAEAEGR